MAYYTSSAPSGRACALRQLKPHRHKEVLSIHVPVNPDAGLTPRLCILGGPGPIVRLGAKREPSPKP